MGYRKVLVTLDGSRLAEQGLKQALVVAEPGAQIHLLSVMSPISSDEAVGMVNAVGQAASPADKQWPPHVQTKQPRAVNARQGYLEEVYEWLEQAGYSVSTEVRTNESPIDAILEVAQANFEVIIMSTHGRTGIGLAVLGSVTQGVLAKAQCPVLVIPPTSTDRPQ